MKYLKIFEKYKRKEFSKRKAISGKNPDLEEFEYLFDNLRDFGFKIFMRIVDDPVGHGILKYCNGHIHIWLNYSFPLKTTTKKEKKDMLIEINDILSELNDRLESSGYLFYNKVSNTPEKLGYWDEDRDRELMDNLHIDYYLFLQSGFKKGTKFKIPDPVYF